MCWTTTRLQQKIIYHIQSDGKLTTATSVNRYFSECCRLSFEEELVGFLERPGHDQIVVLRKDLQSRYRERYDGWKEDCGWQNGTSSWIRRDLRVAVQARPGGLKRFGGRKAPHMDRKTEESGRFDPKPWEHLFANLFAKNWLLNWQINFARSVVSTVRYWRPICRPSYYPLSKLHSFYAASRCDTWRFWSKGPIRTRFP